MTDEGIAPPGAPTGRPPTDQPSGPPIWFGFPFLLVGSIVLALGIGQLREELRTTDPELTSPIGAIAVGALFALAGPLIIGASIRSRRRATAPPQPRHVAGVGTSDDVRVDIFTRSPGRLVVDLVAAPLAGLAFLGVALFGLTQIVHEPGFLIGSPIMGFFGVLLLAGSAGNLRRGIGLRMAEVGPTGLWARGLGHLPWTAIATIRQEANRGAGSSEGPATMTYRRLGIVPRDPRLASKAPGGIAVGMTSAFVRYVNSMRNSPGLTDPATAAPFGIMAFELEQPFESLVDSIRRFAPVLGAGELAAPERLSATPVPVVEDQVQVARGPLTDAEVREIDAQLGGSDPPPAPTHGGAG